MTDEFLDQTRRVKARAKASSVLRARSDGASYEALAVKKLIVRERFRGNVKTGLGLENWLACRATVDRNRAGETAWGVDSRRKSPLLVTDLWKTERACSSRHENQNFREAVI